MQAVCSICSDLFDSQKDVAAIPCGHTFHANCLDEWMKIRKTCPQCRLNFETRHVISKLYFEIAEENGNEVDPADLKNKIKTLEASVLMKEKEKSDIGKAMGYVAFEVMTLRTKKNHLEGGLKLAKTEISALLAQLGERSKQAYAAKAETKVLRDKVKELQKMEDIVHGTEKEAEEVLLGYGVPTRATKPLITYCAVLKKELLHATDQMKLLQQQTEETARRADEAANRATSLQNTLEQQAQTILELEADLKEAQESQNGLRQTFKVIKESTSSPSRASPEGACDRRLTENPALWLLNLQSDSDSDSDDVFGTPCSQIISFNFSPNVTTHRTMPPIKQRQSTMRNEKLPSFKTYLDNGFSASCCQ